MIICVVQVNWVNKVCLMVDMEVSEIGEIILKTKEGEPKIYFF